MDIVTGGRKLDEKDILIIKALQDYAERNNCTLDMVVFPING